MKKLFLLLTITLFCFITINTHVQSASRVKWYDFNKGMKLAKKLKRPVLVDFYASWCGYCKLMDKEAFAHKDVVKKLNREYIPIRIMTESNNTLNYKDRKYSSREFSIMLGVTGLPTILFMDKTGEIITKIPGYLQADVLLPLLSYIKKECYKKKVSFEDYMKSKARCK